MSNNNLQSMKWEHIRGIFQKIAANEPISRAKLSAETGLSLVTVGKIADALLEMNLVRQVKETKPHAGRRVGVLSMNDQYYTVIASIAPHSFSASVLNLRLEPWESIPYTYDPSISVLDNLRSFFNTVSIAITERYELENCFGIGLLVPKDYNRATDTLIYDQLPLEWRDLPLRETMEAYFGGLSLLIESDLNGAALSRCSAIDNYEEKHILYLHPNPEGCRGVYMVNGSILLGKNGRFCDFDKLYDENGTTLSKRLSLATSAEDSIEVLSRSLAALIRILAPHTILLENCDLFKGTSLSEYFPAIKAALMSNHGIPEEILPELIVTDNRMEHTKKGLAMELRELWLRLSVQPQ